jgi:arginase family enzyme
VTNESDLVESIPARTGVQSRIESQYSQRGTQSLPTRRIRVLGVPLDLGASRRGVDMGPSKLQKRRTSGAPTPVFFPKLPIPVREPRKPWCRRWKMA